MEPGRENCAKSQKESYLNAENNALSSTPMEEDCEQSLEEDCKQSLQDYLHEKAQPIISPSFVETLDESIAKCGFHKDPETMKNWIDCNKEILISIWNGEDAEFDDPEILSSYFSLFLAAMLVAKGKTVIFLTYAVNFARVAEIKISGILKTLFQIDIPKYDQKRIRCGVPFGLSLHDTPQYDIVIAHGVFAEFQQPEIREMQLIKFTNRGKGSGYISTGSGCCHHDCD